MSRLLPRWPLFALILLAVPFIEITVLIAVGQQIGVVPTVAAMLAASALGGWLVAREGPRAFRATVSTLAAGQLPALQLIDGALVLVGAALLLTPGFVTDAVGLVLLVPPSRRWVRRALLGWLARRARRHVFPAAGVTTIRVNAHPTSTPQ
jgi:UPF0716 protein FxsA